MALAAGTLLATGAVLAVTVLVCYLLTSKRRRVANMVNKLPGPPTVLLLGNALEEMIARNRVMRMLDERHRKYAPLYRSWTGGAPEIHITRAEHAEIILSSQKYIEKAAPYRFLVPWLGLGLLTSSDAKWHSRRKLITPTFHFKILETFFDVFVEKSQLLVEKLQEQVSLRGDRGFDVYPFVTRCALDIICQTAMGTDIRAQEDIHSEYVHAVADISEQIVQRAIRPHLHPNFIFNLTERGRKYNHSLQVLHGFTNKMILERQAEYLKSGQEASTDAKEDDIYFGTKKRLAFLDLLLASSQDDKKLTIQDLQEEVDTFMFEGHDTTTAGTSWALLMIASHPEVQAKVFEELDSIFQGSDRPITMRDLQGMKYLERVIKETLRLYPSVPFIARELREDTEIGGFTLPAGCTLNIHIYHIHRDPEYFPDPEQFDPDHFLPERVQGRHPYAYVPFSAGPRNCIGQKFAMMEEKTMLASVLRRFELRALEDWREVVLISELILRPESGIRLVLTPR